MNEKEQKTSVNLYLPLIHIKILDILFLRLLVIFQIHTKIHNYTKNTYQNVFNTIVLITIFNFLLNTERDLDFFISLNSSIN